LLSLQWGHAHSGVETRPPSRPPLAR